jgi:thiopurine S-methyltransferase
LKKELKVDNEFWHTRWAKNQIGFHLLDVNEKLKTHWEALSPLQNESVLVPLCGKSEDLVWLSTRHDEVVGVELSDIAVRAFFSEHFYLPKVSNLSEGASLYQFDEIKLYRGDFFTTPLSAYPLVYDRGALIAMPAAMRFSYVERLLSLTLEGGRILLITLSYPDNGSKTPPFSLDEQDVRALFSNCKKVNLLAEDSNAQRPPKAKDFSYFIEQVWLIEK